MAFSSLPVVMSPELISSIRNIPKIPPHSWYFIAATTLSILNLPHEVPIAFKSAISQSECQRGVMSKPAEQLYIVRRMREALIKAGAVGGLPKTINALFCLKAETPDQLLDKTPGSSPTSRLADITLGPQSRILQRGDAFFKANYGKVSDRIMQQMELSGTEDLGAVAKLLYGHIVSNTTILSPVETSYVLIAALIPQDVNPQLKGHLKGALNHGATGDEVRAVREAVIRICEASGMRTLDQGTLGGWGWKSKVATIEDK